MAEPLKLKSGKILAPARSNPSPEDSKQSPWLKGYEPSIAPDKDTFVGFAEYLRWMRSPDTAEKDKTKLEILQLAVEKSKGYKQRLEVLTSRTKRIAGEGNTFEVTSTWRIRVGGQRGPESMLLPAWDALGIPYIPSSTLRGVARDRAIREFMAEDRDLTYNQAVDKMAPYFGSIDPSTPREDRAGKVIFLDAYPVPANSEALAVDIANNIWKWDGNSPKYGARPFAFLSLLKPTFTIGIKPTQKCNDETFDRVKGWLIGGLQSGIGSQVNSGYGELLIKGGENPRKEILQKPIEFTIEGQLIHGVKFTGQYVAQAEVRPIAFRAMLRYWFRAFALGVLPPNDVKKLEAQLFGSIDPTLSNENKPNHGWVSVHILDAKPELSSKNDFCKEQSGTLILRYSNSAPMEAHIRNLIYDLLKSLTWLMFHLGGVGQGARRPLHDRATSPKRRGSNLKFVDRALTKPSETPEGLRSNFRALITKFYAALNKLTNSDVNSQSLNNISTSNNERWVEAVDRNCCIFICQGESSKNKPYALEILHSPEFKLDPRNGRSYDPELCGKMQKPSPVWICNKGSYQVVTVFGANANPRKKYVEKLLADRNNIQIFPMQ
jgi:CRISPR-associated protein Cmr6